MGSCQICKSVKNCTSVKRSGDPGPTPEVGGAPSEGSLTLISNLLGIFVNVGVDIR